MPYKSLKQERYMNWAASKGKISQDTVDEFNKASKGKKLPEVVKHKEKGGIIMKSLAEAIKKKKESEQRKKMWRGGLADVERDATPVEIVGETTNDPRERTKELNDYDKLIAEAKKAEEHTPDYSDTKRGKEEDFLNLAKGGEVQPPKPMRHTPESFAKLDEKEKYQLAMSHLDGPEPEQEFQPEVRAPKDADPSKEKPKMAEGGAVEPQVSPSPSPKKDPSDLSSDDYDPSKDPLINHMKKMAEGGKIFESPMADPNHDVKPHALSEKERFQLAMKMLDGPEPEQEYQPEVRAPKDADPSEEKPKMAEGGVVYPKSPQHRAESFSHLDEKARMQAAMKMLDGPEPEQEYQPEVRAPKDADPSEEKPKMAEGGVLERLVHEEDEASKADREANKKVDNDEEDDGSDDSKEIPEHHVMLEHMQKYAHGDEVRMEHIRDEHKHNYAEGGKLPKLGSGKRFAAVEKSAAKSGASNPVAVAAAAGRKKFGEAKMEHMAQTGKKRHLADTLKHRK